MKSEENKKWTFFFKQIKKFFNLYETVCLPFIFKTDYCIFVSFLQSSQTYSYQRKYTYIS